MEISKKRWEIKFQNKEIKNFLVPLLLNHLNNYIFLSFYKIQFKLKAFSKTFFLGIANQKILIEILLYKYQILPTIFNVFIQTW
jgi:hypothetical protein